LRFTRVFTALRDVRKWKKAIASGINKEAQAQRSATQRRQAAASKAWNPSDQPEWLDEKTYRENIQPRLARLTVGTICQRYLERMSGKLLWDDWRHTAPRHKLVAPIRNGGKLPHSKPGIPQISQNGSTNKHTEKEFSHA
jgi:hypothetical protein